MNSFSDTMMFTEKDVSDLSTGFCVRTQANGKINFGFIYLKIVKHDFIG